jgi:predicted PurR-regulated permease PerM
MTANNLKLPSYVKVILILIGIYVLFTILFIAKGIIVPILFAIIIAILLHPVVVFLVRLKIKRLFAILITLLLTAVIIFAFGSLLVSQAVRLSDSWPELVSNLSGTLDQTIAWASEYFDIKPETIHGWIANARAEGINAIRQSIGHSLAIIGNGIIIIFLLPVYIFLILYYQPILMDFIHRLTSENNKIQVWEVVSKTKNLIQRYLVGLVIEAAIVAILDISVLLIFGIEYAILLGIIGALLNVIPYIGGLMAVALPMLVALATKDSAWPAIYVLIFYYVIQLIDNNYIGPKIVSSKVKINALFSIIAVLTGNALWGVPGMFLSIPLLAIVKLIFDHIESMKPWGFLLGDTMPGLLKIKPILKTIIKKQKAAGSE